MNQRPSSISRIFLSVSAYGLCGVALWYVLDTLSSQLVGNPEWTAYLNYRLPTLLVVSSIILYVISRPLSGRKLYMMLDNVLWLSAPLSVFPVTWAAHSYRPELLTGIFYLSLLTLKSILLMTAVYKRQKLSPINGGVCFIVMFWFFASYGAWHAPVHSIHGDEPHYLLMTHSFVNDGDLNLFNEYNDRVYQVFYKGILEPKPSDYVAPGQIYSRGLGAVFPIILSPFYAIGGFQGAQAFIILCAALLASHLYLLLKTVGVDPALAFLSMILISTTAPVLNYSSLVYPDIPAALFIVLGLRALQIPTISSKYRSVPTWVFIFSAILIFTKFRYFIPVLLLLIPLMIRELKRRRNSIALFLSIGVLGVLYIVADNVILGGDLFMNRFGDINRLTQYMPSFYSFRVIPGLLLDQESGILINAPVYLLVLAGIRLYKGKRDSLYWFAVLGLPLTAISLLGHFAWHSLPTPPLRYLLPVLPTTALFIAASLESWHKRSGAYRLTASLCIFMSWLHIWILSLKPDWQINLADGAARIFSELSNTLSYPIPYFFPSVIRPNSALRVWLVIFALICIAFIRKSWRDTDQLKRGGVSPLITTSYIMAGVVASCFLVSIINTQVYHFEDRFWTQPTGGSFYPANKDPFHHREYVYGWSLEPGASITIPFCSPKTDFHAVVQCRLMDSWLPQQLNMFSHNSPQATVTVSSKNWAEYAFKLTPSTPATYIQFQVPESNTGSVVVDSVRIIRKSPSVFFFWNAAGNLFRKAGFAKLALYSNKRALLTAPGDPWHELWRYFHPGLTTQHSDLANIHPLPENFLDNMYSNAIHAGWNDTHQLENLFNFSIRFKLPRSDYIDYALAGILNGHQPSAILMIRLNPEKHDLIPNAQLIKAIAYYLRGNIPEAVSQVDSFLLKGNHFPMTLSAPSSHLPVTDSFHDMLNDMGQNSIYQTHAALATNGHLIRSVEAFHRNEYLEGSWHFDRFYMSDHQVFLQTIPDICQEYASVMLQRASRIHTVHVKQLIGKSLENQSFKTALAAAQYGLRMKPDEPRLLQLKARTLYDNREFLLARQACLENISLYYNDDYSRWLLQQTNARIHRISTGFGADREEQNQGNHELF